LPEGSWTGFWDGQPYKGGAEYTVEAPLGRLPVFYRTESAFKELFRRAADM
jgi:alpha-glucosidase